MASAFLQNAKQALKQPQTGLSAIKSTPVVRASTAVPDNNVGFYNFSLNVFLLSYVLFCEFN